jgi:fluoroacetyl-CoA thioesterase
VNSGGSPFLTSPLHVESLGSGDVPVLGTPALLALAEGACVEAIAGDLPPGDTSVGTWAEIEHLRAAPTGSTVCAHATLIGHHGRRLEFSVLVEQDGATVAKVRHRRVLVDRERFLHKIADREASEGRAADGDGGQEAPADAARATSGSQAP